MLDVDKAQVNVRLPKELVDEIDELVKRGRFTSKTDAFSDALKLLLKVYKGEELAREIDQIREGTERYASLTETSLHLKKRRMSSLVEALILDASVVMKWFKKGEEHEAEALALRGKILGSQVKAFTSEWLVLEIVRALVKANYPRDKIEEAYTALKKIIAFEFIVVPRGIALDKAKEVEITLSLFVSDSVYLATAIMKKAKLVTEDRHLLRKEVVEYAKKEGTKIMNLKENI